MTPEELALQLFPVKYQDEIGRKHPDRNQPLREAFLKGYGEGYKKGREDGYADGYTSRIDYLI